MNKEFQTTRKHARLNRIVADTFLNESNGVFTYVNVKNSVIVAKQIISSYEAIDLQRQHDLIPRKCDVFSKLWVFRKAKSWSVIDELLACDKA